MGRGSAEAQSASARVGQKMLELAAEMLVVGSTLVDDNRAVAAAPAKVKDTANG